MGWLETQHMCDLVKKNPAAWSLQSNSKKLLILFIYGSIYPSLIFNSVDLALMRLCLIISVSITLSRLTDFYGRLNIVKFEEENVLFV